MKSERNWSWNTCLPANAYICNIKRGAGGSLEMLDGENTQLMDLRSAEKGKKEKGVHVKCEGEQLILTCLATAALVARSGGFILAARNITTWGKRKKNACLFFLHFFERGCRSTDREPDITSIHKTVYCYVAVELDDGLPYYIRQYSIGDSSCEVKVGLL